MSVADTGPRLADGLLLREALTNLIDNAFIHAGSGLSEIAVTLEDADGVLALTVKNDGKPVSSENIPGILARFGQAEPGQGSGLGLSIADAVARRHEGVLTVPPLPDGFAATMRLPLDRC